MCSLFLNGATAGNSTMKSYFSLYIFSASNTACLSASLDQIWSNASFLGLKNGTSAP